MKIYIPTQLGDISLVPEGKKTKLFFEKLTDSERERLEQFLQAYHVELGVDLFKAAEIILPADFAEVHKKFLKVFKAGKGIISAVKFKEGKIEVVKELPAKFETGVSVEKPRRGCPLPTLLEHAEIRAQAVLQEFLSGQQWSDFERYKALIARGNYSGNPYLITSRWNPNCQQYGVLYCLPTQRRICASLEDIPPAEEVLAMKLCVEFIEKEFIFS